MVKHATQALLSALKLRFITLRIMSNAAEVLSYGTGVIDGVVSTNRI